MEVWRKYDYKLQDGGQNGGRETIIGYNSVIYKYRDFLFHWIVRKYTGHEL